MTMFKIKNINKKFITIIDVDNVAAPKDTTMVMSQNENFNFSSKSLDLDKQTSQEDRGKNKNNIVFMKRKT